MRSAARSPSSSASGGAFDTPPEIADALARDLGPPRSGGGRILDPACGTGELLLAALRVSRAGPDWATTSLFGIELSPARARRARERIRSHFGAAAGSSLGRALERNVRDADALDPDVAWPEGTSVLANPPWVSLSGRQRARLPAGRAALYRRAWPSFAGWPSLHGAFLERIARHLAGWGGRARVLLPAAVCELDGYRAVRERVSVHAALERAPEELGERAFRGVTQPAVVVALRGRVRPVAAGGEPWAAVAGAPERELVAALEAWPRLPARSFADPGVHTGNSARELLRDEPCPGSAPVREGRDLAPYDLGPARRHLRVDLSPSPADGRAFRVPPADRQRAFPVLVRQTAARPIAALHAPPGYFRNSLLACREVPGLDPAFVVAVLNGPVAGAWHRTRFRDARQRAFPQVKVGHLDTQPFPIARRGDAPRLHDEVARRVRGLGAQSSAARREAASRAIDELVLAGFGLPPALERRVRTLAAGR